MGRGHDHRQFSPVAHIPHGDEITRVVEHWARGEGIRCDSYYHDLPVWILYRPEDSRIRRLQLTAYLVNSTCYFSLVASVHLLTDGGQKHLVPRLVEPERFAAKRITTKGKPDPQKIGQILGNAWLRTETIVYTADQLMEVAG